MARERLSDATEAFELAERLEREIEAEYEAWKLLLEQMKEADAAQASNLGLALVPAIADQFNDLTRQRYDYREAQCAAGDGRRCCCGYCEIGLVLVRRDPGATIHAFQVISGGVFAYRDCP